MQSIWMWMIGFSLFGHFIVYLTNQLEYYDNLYGMRAVYMSLVVVLKLLIFTIVYSLLTGVTILNNFLILYYIVSILGYVIQFILDNDFVFQLNKHSNYLLVMAYDVVLLTIILYV